MNRIKKKKKLIQHNVTYKKFLKKKERERKRTWLIAIRNFDIYKYIYIYIYIFFKCHQRKNYQNNGDIYCFLEQIEIINLLEIYIISWDKFILITS